MVTYDPKEWFNLIVQFHRSDTFRRLLPTMLLLGGVTAVFCYFETRYLHIHSSSLTLFHQISGFVISLVLVFRINTAYDRWWEGRKLWGSLVNNARNLAIRLHAILPADAREERKAAASLINAFAYSLKEHLRGNSSSEGITFGNSLPEASYSRANHRPNYVARELHAFVIRTCRLHAKDSSQDLIASEHTGAFTDICGGCERIRNTPIPYSYSLFIKKMIFIYIITMPVDFSVSMGYWAIAVVMIMFYAFASLELISEEIEDPFGTDANDLPTDELAEKIAVTVNEILLTDEH